MCVPSCRHQRLGPVSRSSHQQVVTPLPRGLRVFWLRDCPHLFIICLFAPLLFKTLSKPETYMTKETCLQTHDLQTMFFLKKIHLNIFDLHCVNFCCIAKLNTHGCVCVYIYIYIFLLILFHYVLYQNIDYDSLCYTHGLVVYSS